MAALSETFEKTRMRACRASLLSVSCFSALGSVGDEAPKPEAATISSRLQSRPAVVHARSTSRYRLRRTGCDAESDPWYVHASNGDCVCSARKASAARSQKRTTGATISTCPPCAAPRSSATSSPGRKKTLVMFVPSPSLYTPWLSAIATGAGSASAVICAGPSGEGAVKGEAKPGGTCMIHSVEVIHSDGDRSATRERLRSANSALLMPPVVSVSDGPRGSGANALPSSLPPCLHCATPHSSTTTRQPLKTRHRMFPESPRALMCSATCRMALRAAPPLPTTVSLREESSVKGSGTGTIIVTGLRPSCSDHLGQSFRRFSSCSAKNVVSERRPLLTATRSHIGDIGA
eukprot:Rhum_TRINITY_DN3560_c0_g1::Rhum_TRINITY_DN3560_c0_g1_i1::g.11218::m.11218